MGSWAIKDGLGFVILFWALVSVPYSFAAEEGLSDQTEAMGKATAPAAPEDEEIETSPEDPFATPVVRSIVIAPTVKSAEFGLEPQVEENLPVQVQLTLTELFNQSNVFMAQATSLNIEEWEGDSVMAYLEETNSELIAQVFVDQVRIYIIMSDVNTPDQFYLGDQALTLPAGYLQMTAEVLGFHLKTAFDKLIQNYAKGEMKYLPGAIASASLEKFEREEELRKSAQITSKLFRELATIQESPFYMGGSIGMARFAANNNAASTVNFGLFVGHEVTPKVSGELGVDLFSYVLAHLDGYYHLPIAERYLSVNAGFGLGYIVGNLTENLGFSTANFSGGQLLAGPGIYFVIPMLGAKLRGDMRFFLGNGAILVGTYGLEYAL